MKGITMIGMAGSGKSTVGRIIAEKLGWRFVDLDLLIREKEGAHHDHVMHLLGEEEFKRREEKYALELDLSDTVFAPPGSLVYSPRAMEKANAETVVVYLRTEPETIEARLGERLYKNGIVGLKEKGLKALMEERAPLYQRYANHTFRSADQAAEEMADIILSHLTARGELTNHALL